MLRIGISDAECRSKINRTVFVASVYVRIDGNVYCLPDDLVPVRRYDGFYSRDRWRNSLPFAFLRAAGSQKDTQNDDGDLQRCSP